MYFLIFNFIFSFFGIALLIRYMQRRNQYQSIRNDVLATHIYTKKNKPTMAGIIVNIAFLLSCFWTNFDIYVKLTLALSLSFGLIGFIDDYIKVYKRNTDGFRGSVKLILELLVTTFIIIYADYKGLNFMKNGIKILDWELNLGVFQSIFYIIMIVGSANAVNITDGLDGLVILPVILILLVFTFLTNDNNILNLCYILIGGGIALFCFNKYPAKIFMGDVGSLFYGSILAFIAILIRQEFLYALLALIFIIEILSTTLQVFFHFFYGKRLLLAAPLHHHFEKKYWSEREIIFVFWSFFILCLFLVLVLVYM
ncbi:MAG: phospho-N-acetylmuramoyl-pentapeptide-transferase [Rickettsiales bacterium]|jgi:phospho-N-acetylmuramoyl-pentapeptide-transferase|nr:phospho-N-acetylmuramoyl-pentapeptide-transferase [Rickettsiales bacterium]